MEQQLSAMAAMGAAKGAMARFVGAAPRQWRISGLASRCAPRICIDPPADALRDCYTRYETWSPVGAHDGSDECDRALWVLPGEARLMIAENGGQVSAQIGNRRYESLPRVVLFGPTSRITRLTSNSEAPVVTIVLSALGWATLVGRSAAALGDRVVPATDVFQRAFVESLSGSLADSVRDGCVADRIDPLLAAAPHARLPDEPLVRGLEAIIEEGRVCIAERAGEELGVASHVVRRSALRHFGYPPKVLLNRRRFNHALEQMIVTNRGYSEAARHGYFDASHFIRDARRFLGMTPRRFLALAA